MDGIEGIMHVSTATQLPVNDIHPSILTLGRFAGTPVVVVQLQGCTVRCAYCNVPETWTLHTEDAPAGSKYTPVFKRPVARWSMASADEIVRACKQFRQTRVLISGGEPLMHDVRDLVSALLAQGLRVQVETSGTRSVASIADGVWLTVSPKFENGQHVEVAALKRADEIVFPITNRTSFKQLQVDIVPHVKRSAPVYLHVLGGAHLVARAAQAAFAYNYCLTGEFDKHSLSPC